MSKTFETMLACLLYDFGVIFSRAAKEPGAPTYFENKLPGDVLEAVSRQRGPLAGIIQAARRVADPCPSTQAVPTGMALESIFNRLNGRNGRARLSAVWPEDAVQYPSEGIRNDASAYRELLSRWACAECDSLYEPDRANALMALLERCLSTVPAARYDGERCDVSLYHLNRATAAIGCCISRWMSAKGISDPQRALSPHEKPFLLYSLDMSGIQSFIYTISNKGALKGLRARSFYLSMLMEHIADSVLEACGLYRVNLIYAGGGRAQILLPNDGECKRRADEIVQQTNVFLLERFGAALFLASGCAAASAAALSSADESPRRFSDVFREASRVISHQKLQRYGAETLLTLNRMDAGYSDDHECVVCGRSGRLRPHGEDGDMICPVCGALEAFSNALTWDDDILLAVSATENANALPLPGGLWLSRAEDSVPATRFYHINGDFDGRPKTIWLHIGNYCALNGDGTIMTFDELAAASVGVARLGILRADVDSLGALFASGFIRRDAKNPHRYVTLPRYMALSAALTAFFQREINRLVRQGGKTWLPEQAVSENRNVTIVYAGGDDVFLVGAWNEVLDAGLSLRAAFSKYTGGGVTLSAGLGLFPSHEPVGIMADITGDMETDAKLIDGGAKDAIALFAPAKSFDEGASPVFHWDDLRAHVIGDKLPSLHRFFSSEDAEEQSAGNAFLYQVLTQLRNIGKEPIAIARLAYLLARRAPDEDRASAEQRDEYRQFSEKVYRWALEPEENRALQAAILLHVYANRGGSDDDVQQ